jgi:hypothetical protein
MIHNLVKFHSGQFEPHRREINELLAARAVIQAKLQSAPDEATKQQILELEYRPVQKEIINLAAQVCLR